MKSMKCSPWVLIPVVLGCLPVAHAAQEAPSTAPSPSASVSANADSPAAFPTGMATSKYAWPKELSDAPKEEEWTSATELETIKTIANNGWERMPVKCRQRALRAWVRIDCFPPDQPEQMFREGQRFYGSLWGVAGDISGTSGQFELVSKVERYSALKNSQYFGDQMMLKMGAVGTAIFQVKYGAAFMVRLDQIFWAEQYDGGGNTLISPGIIMDVSWALGESYPSIFLKG